MIVTNSATLKGREGIIVYDRTPHPSNRKSLTPMGLLLFNLKWTLVNQFGVFSTNSSVKSTKKLNLWNAYYFMAFMLDEWKVHSYTIIMFVLLKRVEKLITNTNF